MELLRKLKKSEQGSITIFVLSSLLVVLLTMIVIYGSMTNKLSSQAEQIRKIQEEYKQDDSMMDQLYEQNYDIIDELQIGDTVTYTPTGTYNWQAEYYSPSMISGTDDVMLDSSKEEYKISTWRVLDIDKENKQVTLVPTSPTIGKVLLQYAQGYNNGVKLLNDACSSLYGNSAKGIKAKSINIEDIEKYMTPEALANAHEYTNVIKYGQQVAMPYTFNESYPTIYEKENLSVIDEKKNVNGLLISEQIELIGKTDDGAYDGKKTATSIQPYQTYWEKDKNFMQTAFKKTVNGINYYDLIIPKGLNTTYWIASRAINTYTDYFEFSIRAVYEGNVSARYMYYAHDKKISFSQGKFSIFPVVSLNYSHIIKDASNGYVVK